MIRIFMVFQDILLNHREGKRKEREGDRRDREREVKIRKNTDR